MAGYMTVLGAASPTAKSAKDILEALVPPKRVEAPVVEGESAPPAKPEVALSERVTHLAVDLAPGVIGGAVGAYAWKQHRVLGFLAGHAVAANALPILRNRDGERKDAIHMLGVESSGVVGALVHKRSPALGWVLGTVGGAVVSSMFSDSPIRKHYREWRSEYDKRK